MVAEFLEGVDACEVWAVCVSVCAGTREAGSDGAVWPAGLHTGAAAVQWVCRIQSTLSARINTD